MISSPLFSMRPLIEFSLNNSMGKGRPFSVLRSNNSVKVPLQKHENRSLPLLDNNSLVCTSDWAGSGSHWMTEDIIAMEHFPGLKGK